MVSPSSVQNTMKRSMMKRQWDQVPLSVKENGYKALDAFLRHTGSTRSNTRVLFRKYATGQDRDGQPALTLPEARRMIAALVQKLNLPNSFFFDLDVQFTQFDFDGDGTLNAEETSCMVKSILKERRASAGGKPEDCDVLVPYKTLHDGGYVVVRELGRGGQGVMYLGKKEQHRQWFLCRQNDEDTEYCIKFYYKKDSNAGSIHEIVDEFSRMKEFDNEHVARTYETFQDQDFYYLVNEPYFGGDWTKLACKAYESGVHMSEDWWRELYVQCLHGLDYLHRKAQMHCDIKEPNLMVKHNHDYRRPQVVYIDFGLSQAFARKVENVTGTPGYIPPETWQEKAWYPSGDIFSLGVVFFQMLSGRVPSEDGSVRGIFQEGADFVQLAKATAEASPPWHLFPTQWGELARVVASMLQKQKEHRPRAAALLRDPWFQSNSAAPLPRPNLAAIVHRSKEAVCRSDLVNELCETCNLQELRTLQARLDQLRQFGQATQQPTVGTAKFVEVVSAYGASPDVLQNFATFVAKGPMVNYVNLLKEVIEEKEKRSNQLVTNLFNEMDRNGDGHLSYSELRAMLQSDAFDCAYEDVEEVLESMDENQDGYVDFEEMKRAIMEDGRIAMKDEGL